jgi:uncharacterized protein (DUF924 family)
VVRADVTVLTGADVLSLYESPRSSPHPCLADNGAQIVVRERTTARQSGWEILAYQIDLLDQYPDGMTQAQADAYAATVQAGRTAVASEHPRDR